jgi:hypothetical protein
LPLTGSAAFALSPNGKYLAASVESGIVVFDPLTGKTLGRLRSEPLPQAVLSFDTDGKHLAAMAPGHVVVWDFEKGEEYRNIFFPTATFPSNLDWVADGYLLAGGSKLIDLERRIVLWEYRPPSVGRPNERKFGELGGVFWYAAGNSRQQGIIGVQLPHSDAKHKAASLDAKELLVLKPGANVKLTVRIRGNPGEQEKATDDLTAQLKQLGIGIDTSSPLVLAAVTESGKTQQKSYRSFGAGFGDHNVNTVNVAEQIARIRLMEGANVLWEAASISGAPVFVHREGNQSLQQAIDQQGQPNTGFFSSVQLPQYLARPGDGGAYGASVLTETGIRNVPIATLHTDTGPGNAPGPDRGAQGRRQLSPAGNKAGGL